VKASASAENSQDALRRVTLLHTNDEHGWLTPEDDSGGATGIFSRWRKEEALDRDPNLLVVSSGDLWTGRALSTCFAGESTIDVMNAMGYRAAAIGNHEFDNGVDVLRLRAAQANFPFLSANIKDKGTGAVPDFAQPYVIVPVNGVKVALVGLTTLDTPQDERPEYIAPFDFMPYDDALRRTIPRVKAKGELSLS
jgi:2',3'-cyclic-nucleotide 2'-phosphodiesterase/3'-nucleotidase